MPTLVQFGAGNIGRGFVAPLFSAAGWRVVFVDIDRDRIRALCASGRYAVTEVTSVGETTTTVDPVDGIHGEDRSAVTEALASCDLAATAVGLNALPHLAEPLAAGLRRREGPLDVLVCENGADAAGILRRAVAAADGAVDRLGCVRTSIGRMIPPPRDRDDPLAIRVEPYARLPVAAGDFLTGVPAIPALEARTDFALAVEQKLYLHNLSHACFAYAGAERGHRTLPGCLADAGLRRAVRAACDEVIAALVRHHATDTASAGAIAAECGDLVDGLFHRYANTGLDDPVARVARDPHRKLAADDRLIGGARTCLAAGIQPRRLAPFILAA